MIEFGNKSKMHLEISPEAILEEIQEIVIEQQKEFERIWNEILRELKKEKIQLVNEKQLNRTQQIFVLNYFNEEMVYKRLNELNNAEGVILDAMPLTGKLH